MMIGKSSINNKMVLLTEDFLFWMVQRGRKGGLCDCYLSMVVGQKRKHEESEGAHLLLMVV